VKAAVFHARALEKIRAFPEEIRKEIGKAVFDLQKEETLGMPLFRPMPAVAVGVEELRMRDEEAK
jgi:phage-related protein